LGADLVERTAVVALIRLRPASRHRILTAWARFFAGSIISLARRVGRARIGPLPVIPGGPGVLIVMNHQSLLDIPVAFRLLEATYPLVVTRRRYAKGIPLLSHMLRLYDHPLVDPDDRSLTQLRSLVRVARKTEHPLVIFPEGTRTRNGNIQPFRRPGLRAILSARPWTVYVVVVDGFWRCAHYKDFPREVGRVDARVACIGPIAWDDPRGDTDAFAERVRETMVAKLDIMRGVAPVGADGGTAPPHE
jgi:1-acyl-sn-glycerol-3-phosphate acyltransferase